MNFENQKKDFFDMMFFDKDFETRNLKNRNDMLDLSNKLMTHDDKLMSLKMKIIIFDLY